MNFGNLTRPPEESDQKTQRLSRKRCDFSFGITVCLLYGFSIKTENTFSCRIKTPKDTDFCSEISRPFKCVAGRYRDWFSSCQPGQLLGMLGLVATCFSIPKGNLLFNSQPFFNLFNQMGRTLRCHKQTRNSGLSYFSVFSLFYSVFLATWVALRTFVSPFCSVSALFFLCFYFVSRPN